MSLTDDWKAGKLNEKSIWWADLGNEKIEPARVDEYGYLFGLDGCFYSPERCDYVKILAPCDYDHFVELTEKAKDFNYKLLESKQAVDIAHGQALVDEFGDCEAVYQEIIRLKREVDKGDMIIGKLLNEGKAATEKNKQLRQLLKECKEYLSDVDTYFTKNADEATLLLTRIKEVLK